MGFLDKAGRFFSAFGGGLQAAADPMGKAAAPSDAVRPVQTLPEQPAIQDRKTERPLFDGGFGPIYTDFSGKIERAQSGKPAISTQTLFTLSKTDPVTWSIIDVYKSRITEMKPCIVPDIDAQKAELLMWERQASLAASRYAAGAKPVYAAQHLPDSVAGPLRSQLQKVKLSDPDAKKRIRWLVDWAELELQRDLLPLASSAEKRLAGCNGDAVDPWKELLELTIEDICVYDAPAIGCIYSLGQELQQLYHLPGQEVRIYRNPDWSVPEPPHRAYAWEVNGRIIEEFTTDDLLYFPRNPQQNGYGFSPLEVASFIITASLNAEAFNLDSFKSNIPPGILDLGAGVTKEQRERFRIYWNNETQGKDGGRSKLIMSNFGKENMNLLPLQHLKQTDMQMQEYLEWTLLIKCMCYGVSPQEIGFTKFFKYETSNNQMVLTNRGVDDMVRYLEGAITEGILKRAMGLRGLKFQFRRGAAMINKDTVQAAAARIQAGLASQNEIREEWGQRPLPEGGDIAAVTMRTAIVPVAEIGAELEDAGEAPFNPGGGEPLDPDDLEAAMAALAAQQAKGKGKPGTQPPAGAEPPVPAAKSARILEALAKKLNIDYKAPAGGNADRIRGARARRNVKLRAFRKDIGKRAAKLAKERSARLRKLLGEG